MKNVFNKFFCDSEYDKAIIMIKGVSLMDSICQPQQQLNRSQIRKCHYLYSMK